LSDFILLVIASASEISSSQLSNVKSSPFSLVAFKTLSILSELFSISEFAASMMLADDL
jgi:hypothetical protein